MLQLNSDYAFIRCQYYDIPLVDDAVAIIGPQVVLNFNVAAALQEIVPSDTILFSQSDFDITVRLDPPTLNMAELAARFQDAIVNELYVQVASARDAGNSATASQQVLLRFFEQFSGVSYDQAMQKLSIDMSLNPANPPTIIFEEGEFCVAGYAVTISNASVSNQRQSRQGNSLLAALFGGVTLDNDANFAARFSDNVYMQQYDSFEPVGSINKFPMINLVRLANVGGLPHLTARASSVQLLAQNKSSLCYDPYVYIIGSPESDTWTNQGTKMNVLAILPRNGAFGVTQNAASGYLTQSVIRTKTSLSAIRNMTLVLCDRSGVPLTFPGEFTLQLLIEFDIENDK